MCGISGFTYCSPGYDPRQIIVHMRDALTHRGPDGEGVFVDHGVALAHRRLAIIDLVSGAQPMSTSDGQLVITFNGEIYNYPQLKKELSVKYEFITRSDTEVILHAYEEWGESCLCRLNGMFAFALYDNRQKRILLARDRMGKKPLYYSQDQHGDLYFASEPKALFKHPLLTKRLSSAGLAAYLQHEYIPVPLSIYDGIYKLGSGEYLVYSLADRQLKGQSYWQPLFNPSVMTEPEAASWLRDLLSAAVERRLMAEVPLGVFLSGGIDSSAIAALICRYRDPASVKTFSIAFADPSFDESGYARQVAGYLGTTHHEKLFSAQQLIDVLPEIIAKLDEPFADASLLPTYVLSQFTREHVTVALGGDGSDELFAGYPTFAPFVYLAPFHFSGRLIQGIQSLAAKLPVDDRNISWDFKLKQTLKGLLYKGYDRMNVWLGSFSPPELGKLLLDPSRPLSANYYESQNVFDYYQRMYLQEDILFKVDRASMMNSLEVRAPFLDPTVVAFANNLPLNFKLRFGQGKYILKKALSGMLPDNILHRPKKGFGIPVSRWFKQELKVDLLATLDSQKLNAQGIFRADFVELLLADLFANQVDTRKQLWTLYMFQKWYDKEFREN